MTLLGLLAWGALVLLQIAWHGWLVPPAAGLLPALTLAVLPLLLPALALRRPRRALLWTGILCLFYFAHGIAEIWSGPAPRILPALEILLCVTVILVAGLGHRLAGSAKLP